MKFTIITPNFNGSKYIEECIQSVMRQKIDLEHIIIDGKSTDLSSEIFKKYSHLKIISERDKGMYDAINKGLSISKGDIIGYLNCDDRYPDEALLSVIESFENNKDIDYVYGHCKIINHQEQEIYVYKVPPVFRNLLERVTVIPWAQPSIFYKKHVFDYLGNFSCQYDLASDYHFMKKVILSKLRGYKVNKVLSCFMKREDALSAKYSFEMHSEVMQIKNDLGIVSRPVLDFLFNSYRKIYNFHTFFKKNN